MWVLAMRLVFAVLLLLLLGFVFVASADRGIQGAIAELGSDPWVLTTLVDLYIGIFIFWLWVAYRETRWSLRLAWAAAFVVLGNLGTLLYLLARLFAMDAEDGIIELLLREPHAERFRTGESEGESP